MIIANIHRNMIKGNYAHLMCYHVHCFVINEQVKSALPSMYAHNVLGYTNGMHPNLSKVTMLLNPF